MVESVDPAEGIQGQTLDIVVAGAGFEAGDEVVLGLDGSPVDEIVTNSTSFIGAATLGANITIAPETNVGDYDVMVMGFRGRKGIGTALFQVKLGQHQNALVTDLGTLEGRSTAVDINEDGLAVGRSLTGSGWHIVSWDLSGGAALVDHGPGWASAVSGSGQIAGYQGAASTQRGIVMNAATGTVTVLDPLTGHTTSEALDINDGGQVVGWSRIYPSGDLTGVVWDLPATTATALEGLPGTGSPPRPFAINSVGNIVGIGGGRALFWTSAAATPIDLSPSDDWGWTYGVSDPDASGIVYVAGQRGAGNDYWSVVWTVAPDGTVTAQDLASTSYAYDVNSRGQAVGWIGETNSRAYMWETVGGVIELELGALTGRAASRAEAINEQGRVVGWSHFSNKGADRGIEHAVAWQFP